MSKREKSHVHTPDQFQHPVFGLCQREPGRLAIRWRDEVRAEAKEKLLAELELTRASAAETEPPLMRVNQTDGFSWVQSRKNSEITADTILQLESNDFVQWVAAAYRAVKSEPGVPAFFCVNPERVYVRRSAIESLGGVEALRAAAGYQVESRDRVPGHVTLRILKPSLSTGENAIETVQQITAALSERSIPAAALAARYENIPYVSPQCHHAVAEVKTAVHTAHTPTGYCEPPITEFTPNDPSFGTQWGLQRINAPRGWEIARGSPAVTVAVIDEGVELGHPDLDLHPQSWNASTDTPDGGPTGNHGTACAGIIGARLDNTLGVAGVAGGARVMAIATATWADADIAEGLYFAADQGAKVVSMSFGVYPSWLMWDFDLIRDALQYATNKGLVLVAASGNENLPVSRFPGSDARVITVGGSNRSDERKRVSDSSSETFWGACFGTDLDVVAPCLEIPTTDRLAGSGYALGDYFDRFNGTSAATPHVAGLAALILSLRPGLTNVEVRNLIESTCDKISPALYSYGNVGHKASGTWNDEVGYGRINVERALLAACALQRGTTHECDGCGGECIEPVPAECMAPAPVPWLPFDRCMYFYETRSFDIGRIDLKVSYEHCLRLLGRQQGPLLYTTTLLPGEQVKLYQYDRFRRVRAETDRVSVHSSFRQTVSALSQSRRTTSASSYSDTLRKTRSASDVSVSVGGGLAGFLGAPSGGVDQSQSAETTVASGSAASFVGEQFTQFAITASQSLEAERSIVVSTFEEAENRSATERVFKNANDCYAVTYYIRRVLEVYEASTRVVSIEWKQDGSNNAAFRSVNDLAGVGGDVRNMIETALRVGPRIGETRRDHRFITIPTDGTIAETELAYCSSCEPMREAGMRMELEQKRLETRTLCLQTDAFAQELELGDGVRRAAALAAFRVSANGVFRPQTDMHTLAAPAIPAIAGGNGS